MNVLVYSGKGVSAESLHHTVRSLRNSVGVYYDVKLVSSETLAREPWEEGCSLLVFPGGRDLPFVHDLQGRACQRIRQWILNHDGRFLGICAGAYFACREVDFEPGTSIAVRGPRELALCPATARGTLFSNFEYGSEKGAYAALIKLSEIVGIDDLCLYYNGGCWFDFSERREGLKYKIIGHYAEKDDKPAISGGFVNDNDDNPQVILSGVHIEYDAIELAKNRAGSSIPPMLCGFEENRLKLWNWILKKLGLHVRDVSKMIDSNTPLPTPLFMICCDSKLVGIFLKRLPLDVNDEFRCESSNFKIFSGKIPADVGVANDDYPLVLTADLQELRTQNWSFSADKYFSFRSGHPSLDGINIGKHLLYSEYIASTQTLLTQNSRLANALPNGTIVLAGDQLEGKGRGVNTWLSSKGCLQFTMVLHHQDSSNLTLIQYLIGLAMITAIIDEPSYQFLGHQLKLKWPNDLYSVNAEGKELKKIGGVLVNSQTSGDSFLLLIGFGFNVYDTPWTRSLNDLIDEHNRLAEQYVMPWSKELLLARFCSTIDQLYHTLITTGFPFDLYYRFWLHSGQIVFLEDEQMRARIEGIDHNGYLIARPHSDGLLSLLNSNTSEPGSPTGQSFLLQPDGNSFDMMKNLIKRKL